jgi:hypothetical protein
VEGPNASSEDALCTITNVSSDNADTMFKWAITTYNIPSQWLTSFCDTKDCYSALSLGMNKTFNLRVNGSGTLKATFDFQVTQGMGCMIVLVSSVKNPTFTDTVSYCATAWPTAVKEISGPKSFVVFPNPVKDILNIQYNSREKISVEIYNVLGSKVRSFIQETLNSSIDVSDLDKGMYFIRVKERNTITTRTFTKAD